MYFIGSRDSGSTPDTSTNEGVTWFRSGNTRDK
jgi:hypothetical protein